MRCVIVAVVFFLWSSDAAASGATVVYAGRDGNTFSVEANGCYDEVGSSAAQIDCQKHTPILQGALSDSALEELVDMSVNEPHKLGLLCNLHKDVCKAVREHQDNSAECDLLFGSCQSALRHLHRMMFSQSPGMTEPQVCNNFARKSIRGFFHDFMSHGIDGSILSECNISINFGLCRWTQYVNVLSDETGCDPGSIIAMAGELGYEACGVPIWEQDRDAKPFVTIGLLLSLCLEKSYVVLQRFLDM